MYASKIVRLSGVAVLTVALAACGTSEPEASSPAAMSSELERLSSSVDERLDAVEGRIKTLEREKPAASSGASHAAAPAATSGAAAHGGAAPHWTYAGAEGPDAWGTLSSDFKACQTGKAQSPIDLAAATAVGLSDIAFAYKPAAYEIVNNGHTIQANTTGAGGITVDGAYFDLVQFHAHAPSEHTVGGKPVDLEVHLVHKSRDGKLAVVGVLMQKGAVNKALAKAWAKLPAKDQKAALASFDAATLLPRQRLAYRYSGSLTTPPCSEGVRWLVLKDAVPVDAKLVSSFSALFGPNARPVQQLNNRALLVDVRSG